jgi:RimJ/RimL family protein N-acetyltransferase
MKPILTQRLILRNWEERDRELFYRINSDDEVLEFFPFRRSRAEADAKMEQFRSWIAEDGYGFAAAEIAATGQCIGFVGLFDTDNLPFLPEGTIEIGWRLAPEFWGKGYVTEAAKAWLTFGFETLGVEGNRRSTAVMQRIGMTADRSRDFDHPGIPDSHPQLRRHVFYALRRQDWEKQRAAR